ncbi:hypothetical protein HJ590_13075 [Naumannella sp. ID2617S]|nr:hypothetical protein [Naumannella sp. ID2617S]
MSNHTITEEQVGGLGGETTTVYRIAYDGKPLRTVYHTREQAEAQVARFEERLAKISAWGDRLQKSSEGLSKAQLMRGARRWIILDADGQHVATYDSIDEVPMPEQPAEAADQPAEEPEVAEVPAVRGTITEAQAETILDLIADGAHQEGGYYAGPTTRSGVYALSYEDASHYLTSLRGNY